MKPLVIIVLSTLFFVGQGCAKPASVEPVAQDTNPPTQDQTQDSTYQPFTRTAYEQAKADGKPILLNFFANWCPTCAAQEPRTEALFINKKIPGGIIGFRINYNDSDTDADEVALAKQLGVTYQHTYIYFNAEGKETARTIGTTPDTTIIQNLQKSTK